MITHLLKNLFVLMIAFTLFINLANSKISNLDIKMNVLIICLSVLNSIYGMNNPLFSILFSFISFFLATVLFFHAETKFVFFVSLISFCLSHVLIMTSIFSYCFIISLLFQYRPNDPNSITFLFSGIIAIVLSGLLCRWNKFKKGIKYLYKAPYINIVVSIGITLIAFLTIPQVIKTPDHKTQLISLLILSAAFLLFFLWQRQIKHYYLSKLRKLELESLRQELAEKEEQIKQLTASNEDLARTIHKDNKLIPAMLSAVTDYLAYTGNGATDRTEHGTALARQLRELGSDRMELLAKCTHANGTLPQSGHAAVDAMLSYMEKRAEAEDIAFQVKIHSDFSSKINTEISEVDLTHLLSDLIENALIATKTAHRKSILVHLGVLCNTPIVEISDTGNPFAPEVYQDFGLNRHSTHLEDGGSGIGLMDIWNLKKKYAASLHIYEYVPAPSGFSKKICLLFDHKKHYLIRTCRPEELLKVQVRGDLYILPLEDVQN